MNIDQEAVLIGHSCGGGFLVRYLSENSDINPKRVILVAPWLDPKHELTTDFFKFNIDSNLASRMKIDLFTSSDDDDEMQISLQEIKEKIPGISMHEFTDKGHFCEEEFPELLELLK